MFGSDVGKPACGARGAGARPAFSTIGAIGEL
jgi:hypothetical protein